MCVLYLAAVRTSQCSTLCNPHKNLMKEVTFFLPIFFRISENSKCKYKKKKRPFQRREGIHVTRWEETLPELFVASLPAIPAFTQGPAFSELNLISSDPPITMSLLINSTSTDLRAQLYLHNLSRFVRSYNPIRRGKGVNTRKQDRGGHVRFSPPHLWKQGWVRDERIHPEKACQTR